MTPITPYFASACALVLALIIPSTAHGDSVNHESRDFRSTALVCDKTTLLDQLYAQFWEEYLELKPLSATAQGDSRYNDRLPNFFSEEYRERSQRFHAEWLRKVESVGPEGLQGQALISYQVFVRNARDALAAAKYPSWKQPIDQFYNFPSRVAQLGSGAGAQPFTSIIDYAHWYKRASKIPRLFDQAIANMEQGVADGVVQPNSLMIKVIDQLDALIAERAEDTLFWKPVENIPRSFSGIDRERIKNNYRQLITQELMPAYYELRNFIANDYLPHTRKTDGLRALPDGEAWYASLARDYTTTDLTPAEIHEIGLDEVARLHSEIRKIMVEVGFEGSLEEFFSFMQTEPRFTFKSEEALLATYRGIQERVHRRVAEQFLLTPEAKFEIRPIPSFQSKTATAGTYQPPSGDGTRPGIFWVNTYNLPTRKTWAAENLYLHEAIPGHHFQLALQQELQNLPDFRRFGGETAFIEGWGLYAESLGKDLGIYVDPYSDFGYLHNELWRAIRLVVDTGMHSKGWTREQVVDYMLKNSAESEAVVNAEAERYMAIPGQALAYKIGALKIQELRDEAEMTLGTDFDVREFHAELLRDGSVPLDVLEDKMNRWIHREQADSSNSDPSSVPSLCQSRQGSY